MNDVFETKDKQLTPYFFTNASIHFEGTRMIGESIYFLFSPKAKALELFNLFVTRRAEPVQPKDLLEAVETYRDFIFQMKEKNKSYGNQKSH